MFRAPRQLPPLDALLSDIGQPAPAVVARALGVAERTVFNWLSRKVAPRPAALALFWESQWGHSVINAESVNGERFARAHADALAREVATLNARIAYLERVGQFGSANAPTITGPASLLGEATQARALDLDRDGSAFFAR